MAIEYILVDYENTQPKADEVALVQRALQRLWIFRGPGQKKYEAEFVEALLNLGDVAKVVRCEKSGANALDMHIAFELGRLAADGAAQAPAFTVVSKDTDYEPLLQYLRKLGYAARREKTLSAVLSAGASAHEGRAASAKPAASKSAGRSRGSKQANTPASKDTQREPVKTGSRSQSGGSSKTATKAGKAVTRQPAAKQIAKQPTKVAAKQASTQAPAQPPKQSPRPAARPAARQAAKQATHQAPQHAPPSRQAEPARPAARKSSKTTATGHASAQPAHIDAMRAALEKQPTRNRPTRLGSLRKWMENRRVPAAEVDSVIAALQSSGDLHLDATKVLYPRFD